VDGELLHRAGLCYADGIVILFGAVREDVVSVGGRTGSAVAAYWRTDGVTTNRTHFAAYIGLLGSTAGAVQGYSRAAVIQRDISDNQFVLHTNIAAQGATGTAPTDAKTAGPAVGDSYLI
jgi:hypothetical protein